ncbi:tRNA epoxyqueuosine(34) reductase QueG [Candidatus Amarobacter glycogenicus]|uniref:tRNA epoxyqueuosine(34) reductase QueG n=1 Tax=Candidatus Amarobacter glycogenicus TaxID=3140699 RepID=UPI002A100B88|nr:tRNA epoxyqueuosine(34) reductase QueG [Dehalococcoidia bacterium]
MDLRESVLAMARAEGFELAGIAPAGDLPEAREAARAALDAGYLAGMAWMTGEWLERATTPDRFLPGARSIVVVALPNHSPEPELPVEGGPARGRIARYARGRDYHRVFETRLRRIARRIREELGAEARATVDYGPLLERPQAELAGLAWRGKSTMALVPGFGPWVMLGVVATTLALQPDEPLRKSCGSCTRCIAACPTGAIAADGHVVDSRLCISYQTIENRGPIPRELRSKFGARVFGCDDCLDACPVGAGRFESHPDFLPASPEDAAPRLAELLPLDDAAFTERFRGRAIMRAKRDGLLRNACVALGNVGTPGDLDALTGALTDRSPTVRGHAAWAVAALANRHGLTTIARTPLENALVLEHDSAAREEFVLALAELRGDTDG